MISLQEIKNDSDALLTKINKVISDHYDSDELDILQSGSVISSLQKYIMIILTGLYLSEVAEKITDPRTPHFIRDLAKQIEKFSHDLENQTK